MQHSPGALETVRGLPKLPAQQVEKKEGEEEEEAGPAVLKVAEPTVLMEEEGLVLQEQTWTIGERIGTAWRVRVPLPIDAAVIHSERVTPLEQLQPKDPGPWAAINGAFYEKGPMGLVVSDGVIRHELEARGGTGIFFVDQDGPMIIPREQWKEGPPQALQSIDRLIHLGENLVADEEGAPRAARSAVVVGQHHVWLVVTAADGSIRRGEDGVRLSHTGKRGFTLWEFAEYLRMTTDVIGALNLDGAISSQMAVVTKDASFRVRGESGTINAVVLRPVPPE